MGDTLFFILCGKIQYITLCKLRRDRREAYLEEGGEEERRRRGAAAAQQANRDCVCHNFQELNTGFIVTAAAAAANVK